MLSAVHPKCHLPLTEWFQTCWFMLPTCSSVFWQKICSASCLISFWNCCFSFLCVRKLVHVELLNTWTFIRLLFLCLENMFFYGSQVFSMLLVVILTDKNPQVIGIMLNILDNSKGLFHPSVEIIRSYNWFTLLLD